MATTSTNKQPMMQDRVFHNIVDLKGATIGETDYIEIGGSNSAALLLDCTKNDGAVVAELYAMGRETDTIVTLVPKLDADGNPETDADGNVIQEEKTTYQPPYTVCVYMSTSNDFLRNSQAKFVAAWDTGGTLSIMGPLVDADGNPLNDADGNPIVDADGNPVIGVIEDNSNRTIATERTTYLQLPHVLAPVPGVGSTDDNDVLGTQFRSLYVPKGHALWAAVQKQNSTDGADNAPLVAVQGGYY